MDGEIDGFIHGCQSNICLFEVGGIWSWGMYPMDASYPPFRPVGKTKKLSVS